MYHLPFFKEFPADYQTFHSKPTSTIVNMKDNLLFRMLMLREVNQKKRNKVEKELETNLQGEASTHAPPTNEASSPTATLWSDVGFDTLRFKMYHLPFFKEFPADYQTFHSKPTSTIVNMKDNLLFRMLMLREVNQKKRNKVEKELETNLQGEASTHAPPTNEASSPTATLWSDVGFDTLRFKMYHLPFFKEFPADYQTFHSKPTSTIVNMKDNLLFRMLMLREVNQKKRNKVEKELETNLQGEVDAYNERHKLLQFLPKDKEK
ncbi:hypothetical protein KIW84_043265 [Lathyrus oleraceus]|uniref:Uncharacterized protein n=1 Tax=Pisum sativum TaxID=3888 RepID=A0A9D4XD56_PEA|nr:hypothetical protein KIW84_043265 [Pisum sativum]